MTACGQTSDALAALDAEVRLPDRDVLRDVALLELGGAGREAAVDREGRDGQELAFVGQEAGRDALDEVRGVVRHERQEDVLLRDGIGGLDLVEVGEGGVDRGVVHLDDGLAALAVGFLDGLLDHADRLLGGQDAGELEEAGLHDGVDAGAHLGFAGDLVGVDDVELESAGDELLLDLGREVVPDGVGAVDRVEEDGGTLRGGGQAVELLEEAEHVHRDELGLVDEVGRVDRGLAEAEVRDGLRAGLPGVVDEVALGVEVGAFADDLDAVLVGADGAVGPEAPEERRGWCPRARSGSSCRP